MNERIKECWLTAARQDCGDKWDTQEEFIERFAELIVKECISTMESAENGYKDYRNQIEDGMRDHCIGLIKHKFGVE